MDEYKKCLENILSEIKKRGEINKNTSQKKYKFLGASRKLYQ
ncbi:MAG: hypothetical protein RR636_14435 [Clostridium sp.]